MNKQEIFDKVYLGLKSQGFIQALGEFEDCQYRGVNGTKCAVGFLIEDEDYTDEFEGVGIVGNVLLQDYLKNRWNIEPDTTRFLLNLQHAHDDGFHPNVMKINLTAVAKEHGLTIPE